jgi:hypothetical protein
MESGSLHGVGDTGERTGNLDNLAEFLKKVKGRYHKSQRHEVKLLGEKVVSLSL